MITSGNSHGVDAHGHAVLYSSQRQQVMMHWEQQYMRDCVDALRIEPTDRVLEIGFGLAYSATHIQHFHPRSHTIVECDAAVLRDAEQFARAHGGAEVHRGTWQSVLPTLRGQRFDCVFFDDYPLPELERAGVTQNETRSLRTRSRWHDFLDAVLPLVAVGGRITGYLARDIDLARRGCRVTISQVRVAASSDCSYYSRETALVPVITVIDPQAAASCRGEDSDAGRVALARVRMSDSVRHRIASHHSCRSARPSSPCGSVHIVASSSHRRRFADIRECLAEQECVDLLEAHDDEGETPTALDSSKSAHYSDATSRAQFLAALRAKRASAARS